MNNTQNTPAAGDGVTDDTTAIQAEARTPLLPQYPAYCNIHRRYKWCEHNGGVPGPTGWEAPPRWDLGDPVDLRLVARVEAAIEEYRHGRATKTEFIEYLSKVPT